MMFLSLRDVLCCAAVLAVVCPASWLSPLFAAPLFEQSTVFVSPSDNHPNYRIPSLVQAANGDLLVIAERRNSGPGDVGDTDLVLRRSGDLGQTWSSTRLIFDGGVQTQTDATPFVDPTTGQVMLFFLHDKKRFSLIHSDDDGQTWSAPVPIHDQIIPQAWDQLAGSYNTMPGEPSGGQSKSEQWETGWYQRYGIGPGGGVVKLSEGPDAGRIVVPARAKIPSSSGGSLTTTFTFYSDDGGSTWQRGGSAVPFGSEAQLVELSGGRIMVNARDADTRHDPDQYRRRIAVSDDGGETWPAAWEDPYLEDPSVHASIARYQYGGQDVLLFVNPKSSVRTADYPYGRENMSIQVSTDEGNTWSTARTIYPYASSYSDIAVLNDGSIGVVFERGPDNSSTQYWGQVHYVRLNMDWIMAPTVVHPITDNLLLYCSFDGASASGVAVPDLIAPATNGTRSGAASQTVGRFNEGGGFTNGAADFGDVLDPGDGSYTVSFWFKADAKSGFLVSKGNQTSGSEGWSIHMGGGQLRIRTKINPSDTSNASRIGQSFDLDEIDVDTWYHLVMVIVLDEVFDETRVRGYLNGANAGWYAGGGGADSDVYGNAAAVYDSSDPLRLGVGPAGVGVFSGVLDDLAIWGRALSDQDIQAIYQAGLNDLSLLQTPEPSAASLCAAVLGTLLVLRRCPRNAHASRAIVKEFAC